MKDSTGKSTSNFSVCQDCRNICMVKTMSLFQKTVPEIKLLSEIRFATFFHFSNDLTLQNVSEAFPFKVFLELKRLEELEDR